MQFSGSLSALARSYGLRTLSAAATIGYVTSMFIVPMWRHWADWTALQEVWDRWQALNVGVLALAASVIALQAARAQIDGQRSREFAAAKALLPSTLSQLVEYFQTCAEIYVASWKAGPGGLPTKTAPAPPRHGEVLQACIRASPDPLVDEYVARLLSILQVHDARLRDFVQDPDLGPDLNVIYYLFQIGEMQAMVNRLFPFARGSGRLNAAPLKYDELHAAYASLGIEEEEVELTPTLTLTSVTKRRLAAGQSVQD